MASPDQRGRFFPKEAEIPPAFHLARPYEQREYLIDGTIHIWNGPTQEVLSPICLAEDGEPRQARLGGYPRLTEKEALAALAAAAAAYGEGRGPWPTMSVAARIGHLEEFARRMREKRAEVVKLLMWEIGKTYPEALKEFDRTVDYIAATVAAMKELDRTSSRFLIEEGIYAQVRRAPLGVALCLGPYNYPLNETFTTLIPALLMGNTVIFKPPKLGVLLHRPLLTAFRDSFPKGVVNTVYGDGPMVVRPLMASGKIAVLAFIGSSRVADILKKQHPAPHRLRCVLGLEAKNAAIVLPDADLELTVKECLLGALSYNGQRCTALKILFVHRALADRFLEMLSRGLAGMKAGMPWEEGVQLTPLPEPGKCAWLQQLVTDAEKKGARVVNPGGGRIDHTYYSPAVLYPVNRDMRLWREEQFGPLVPVAPFDDIEEPLRYLIESNYGQQTSLFGSDPQVLARLIDPLVNQVCRLNLNSQCQRGPDVFPFTGRKDSAEGTLSVSDALRVFSIRTLVAAKGSELNRRLLEEILRQRHSNFLNTDFIF